MDKTVLYQYCDACGLVKETEERIARLREEVVHDTVKGSMTEWPYCQTSFRLEGVPGGTIAAEERRLRRQKDEAAALRSEVEAWLETAPPRMNRIIQLRIIRGLTWGETAAAIGRGATAEGIRKEFDRYMKKL